ncbi:MAG TPA: C45 family peptidase [Nocardioidaceae bacterium]|nr:C45 family peptidase [Nocardioidaceae bacterium]
MPRTFTSSVLPPSERGLEFGTVHRAEVGRTVAAYGRLFEAAAGHSFDPMPLGRLALERTREFAPALADEIAGMAAGAHVDPELLGAVNARTEVLAVANPRRMECSTVVVLPPAAPPIAVQTWDWYLAMSDGWVHWTIPHPDGRRVETVTEYGVVGKIGVSSAGVGVLFNMLRHELDGQPPIGVPLHVLSRQVLDTAGDLDSATELVTGAPVSASSAITLVEGHAHGGRAVSIEAFPGGRGLLPPDGAGLLVRTNHFLSPQGAPGCIAATIGPGTRLRYAALVDGLAGPVPPTEDRVLAVMDDHPGHGYGVCAHPDPATAPLLRHGTLATVVIRPVEGQLQVSEWGPCRRGPAEGQTDARHVARESAAGQAG